MFDNVGTIAWDSKIDTKQLKSDAAEAERIAKNTGDDIGSSMEKGEGRASAALGKMAKFATVAAATVGAAFVAAVGKFVIGGGISRALNIEDAQAKLKGLGHDVQAVTAIMDSALSAVKGTAFALDEAATTAATAVAAGVKPGKELTKYLGLTADAATVAGLSMADMGRVFNKVETVQAAYNDSLLELSEKGIPIYQWLSKELGISAKAVKDLASEGGISSEVFRNAIEKNIAGAALESGKTTRGAWANMQAAMSRVGAAIVKDIIPRVRDGFGSMTVWFDENSDKIVSSVSAIGKSAEDIIKNIINLANQVSAYLAPKLSALWTSISVNLIPILKDLWQNVIVPLIPVLGTVLVGAVGLVIDILTGLVTAIGWVSQELKNGNPVIIAVASAFGTLAAAMILTSAFNSLQAGFALLTTTTIPLVMARFAAMSALIATPLVMPAILVAAAIAAIWSVVEAHNAAKSAIEGANAAIAQEAKMSVDLIKGAKDRFDRGEISRAELQRLLKIYSRASGGPVSANQPYFVGENRDGTLNSTSELFIPRTSGSIMNSSDLQSALSGGGGSNVTVNLSLSGIMTRSKSDERDIAKTLIKRVNEELSAKNQPIIGGGNI